MRWALLIVLVVTAACGGSSKDEPEAPPAPPSLSATVTLKDLVFKPTKTNLLAGGTVTWIFKDGSVSHNVTAADKSWASDNFSKGTYQHTFAQPGVYKYVCTIHPAMKGTVTVTPA